MEGFALAHDLKYIHGEGSCLIMLGSYHASDFSETIDYYFKALTAFEKGNNNRDIAWAMGSIAGVFYNIGRYGDALDYFKKARTYINKTGDKAALAGNDHSTAATYGELGNIPMLMEHENAALPYYLETGKQPAIAGAYMNLGDAYAALKDYNMALVYLFKAQRIFKTLPVSYQSANTHSDIGRTYYLAATAAQPQTRSDSLIAADRNVNLSRSLQNFEESYKQYIQLTGVPPQTLKDYSEAVAETGAYERAWKLLQQYDKQKSIALSEDIKLKVAAHEVKREAELKNRQIAINQLLAKQKKTERILFITGITLLSILVGIVLRNYKRQRKANARLEEEKKRSDTLARNLQDSLAVKDELTIHLQDSLVHKDQLAAQLELSAVMKSKFLANISHELRTPVTLLTGMLELLRENKNGSGKPGKEKLEIAYNNSRKLQNMVEEILDLSKLENTESKLNNKSKEAAPLVKRMVYAFETFIEKEGLTLNYAANDVAGLCISVDEDKFEKIINNLVYNAIKYNSKGGWISVVLSRAAHSPSVVISISNSGTPISDKDLPHIFQRFYQGNTTAKAKGAGIGLSLVKEYTLLQEGSVSVSSTAEKDTTFTLEFPLTDECDDEDRPAADDEPIADRQVWEHFPGRQTVLLVEDNTEMRYYIREVLTGNVNLAEAANGIEALKWLDSNNADLIISDIMMPEMDGRELVNRLKSNELLKKIPVITLTALADKENQIAMLRLGIDDYIVKPFNATELQTRVYNLLNNRIERLAFNGQPAEADDIPVNSKEADAFREKIAEYVLARIKNTNISVYDLAYELAISERQLYRLAKNLTGCSPAQLVKEVRLQRSHELLLTGDICKLEDVARRVGFETPAYFSRQFFDRFGKRPTDFL
ncbi:MAG: response regulator [Bacteroidota bacterium]